MNLISDKRFNTIPGTSDNTLSEVNLLFIINNSASLRSFDHVALTQMTTDFDGIYTRNQ